jgi:hypothetical protein
MKRASNILFFICSLLFICHQYFQKVAGINVYLADSYLDPLLSMPIILHLINIERNWLQQKARLSIKESFCYSLLMIIAGEFIFPAVSTQFTFDFLDIMLYPAGTALYIISEKMIVART